ncbi:hypothetical protein SMC26_17335 [Actinomadura fulvescens]|uniref:Uncharacterized protein n=1 Tax=Actinomadura fulvescens TaxID=46160 RepID=A0ABP6CNY3_9ACTN
MDVVAKGMWTYADSVLMPVFIVGLRHDFWYEVAKEDGRLDLGEEPQLKNEGFAYYVSFHGIRADGSFWPDSEGHLSIEDAKTAAASKVPTAITWSGTPT